MAGLRSLIKNRGKLIDKSAGFTKTAKKTKKKAAKKKK